MYWPCGGPPRGCYLASVEEPPDPFKKTELPFPRPVAPEPAKPGARAGVQPTMPMQSFGQPPPGSGYGGFGQPPGGPPVMMAPAPAPPSSSSSGAILGVVGVIGCLGIVALMGIGVFAGAFFYLERRGSEPVIVERPRVALPFDAHADRRFRVPVTADQAQRGAAHPLVTIVAFSDYQCPYCERANGTIARVLREYPDARLVVRHNPLPMHHDALPATHAALEVRSQRGDDAFFSMHDALLTSSDLGLPTLRRLAGEQGVSGASIDSAVRSSAHAETIGADQELASQLGARGTPTFFINGRLLRGAQPYERFRELMEAERGYAQAAVNAGIPLDTIYDRIVENGRTSPLPEAAPDPEPSPAPTDDEDVAWRIPVGRSFVQGPDDALVTIVEVSDFECPFCARVQPTLEQIRERYGDDVRFVFKHNPLPFHRRAAPAAHAAIEAGILGGPDAFWRMHDAMFANTRALDDEDLAAYARQVGVDPQRVVGAVREQRHRALIAADQALVTSAGARGTPSFFINGRRLTGAQPFSAFQGVIDAELARARAMVEAGTPRAAIYNAIMAEARPTDGAAHPSPPPSPPGQIGAPGNEPAQRETPSRAEVVAAMRAVSPAVRACDDGSSGVANVRVVFGSNGRVTSASVAGGGLSASVRGCIARAVRGATVPRFRQASFTVNYPFRL